MIKTLIAILCGICTAYSLWAVECKRPWIFFDLGETLIATYIDDNDKTNDYKNMKYLDGAFEYLQELEKLNYPIGLIVDVPEKWGTEPEYKADYADIMSAKIRRTMDFVEGKIPADGSSWSKNPGDLAMDWHFFGNFVKVKKYKNKQQFRGKILLPRTKEERKSDGSTVLFERAKDMAMVRKCKVLYMGEVAEQMELAKKAGVIPFRVGHDWPTSFFLPVEKIQEYIDTHKEDN
ncbi:MAG: hypothetical protein HY072_02430 [Deltaproteobacteria bacterium]|nr:hypothetical protein [Deltaproteobacteria bacterium]